MHDAAEAGSIEIIRMLLEAGAKNVPDESGVTPILCAAVAGHEAVLRSLIEYVSPQERRDALKVKLNTVSYLGIHLFFMRETEKWKFFIRVVSDSRQVHTKSLCLLRLKVV